jgi:hypothetical protein
MTTGVAATIIAAVCLFIAAALQRASDAFGFPETRKRKKGNNRRWRLQA